MGVFLSGFVINEPAPYEIYMVVLVAVWALFGLRISRTSAVLLTLLVVFNIGGMISMLVMPDLKNAPLYIAVSLFLAFTAVFYASIIESDARFLATIFNAYVASAVVTALLGILGYFQTFPGAEIFTLYDRAKGAFQDPNVFGPFLMLPVAWLVHGILAGRTVTLPLRLIPLLVISFGVFLSFSRAAWGMMMAVVLLVALLLLVQNRSGRFRLRVIVLGAVAAGFVIAAILVALQIPSVAELFGARARLVQDYDDAQFGRFARHWIGFMMATENPLGIGPLQFGPIFGEDTHNIWLKALLDYGWIGFAAYLILTVLTLGAGFKILFRERPWQSYLLCAYVVYFTHCLIGNVIDTDHWRHFYVLLGIIWGCVALEMRHQIRLAHA